VRATDLQDRPLWNAETLGLPLPGSAHAVSVSLPRWQDVVDYEEKRPEVVGRLACGYPRFVVHPLVEEVGRRLGGGRVCLPFPSARAAERALEFVRRRSGAAVGLVEAGGLHGVATDASGGVELRAFWQHSGLIVSSRQAEAYLGARGEGAEADGVRVGLRRLLAGLYGCGEDDVFLTPTGMAAQYLALEVVRQRRPGAPTVQLGFPYVDTLKLQQKLGDGGILLHDLERVEGDLRGVLSRVGPAACFGEIPGNPLLGSADLRRITPILRRAGVPLVADDVVATPWNVDLAGHADLVATSLTKYFVGTAEAMGGAVICLPDSPLHGELRERTALAHEELLWGGDAEVLLAEGRGFVERMVRHNAHGLEIAERLRAHPAVERVWYPRWEFAEVYESVRRPQGGWGGLVTFLPRNAAVMSPVVYDRLEVCKGPSLGTVFTLACPFTLLAHYAELDWAERCGVPRHLIRLSVGLEDPGELWGRLARALEGRGGG
jgi:cystathionine gamma-synthase